METEIELSRGVPRAIKVRDLPVTATGARQSLYQIDPVAHFVDWKGDLVPVEYVVVSALPAAFDTGEPETYIFESDESGKVLDWSELPGSFRGGLDEDRAIQGLIDFCLGR